MKSIAALVVGIILGALVHSVLPIRLPANFTAATPTHHHRVNGAPQRADASGGFHSEVAEANARMHAAMEIEPAGDVDRDFIQMMVPHHQGAIDMALVLLKYGRDERLKRLAQSIVIEQGQEIAYMRSLPLDTAPMNMAPNASPSETSAR